MFPGDEFPEANGTIYTVTSDQTSPTGYNSRKAWIPESEREGIDLYDWDINYRYLRYAEVLLLYAESLNEVNQLAAALNLLNQVRARARNTPAIDPQRISCAQEKLARDDSGRPRRGPTCPGRDRPGSGPRSTPRASAGGRWPPRNRRSPRRIPAA